MDRLAALLRRSVTDPRTDGQLLAAFLTEREEAAFVELVRRHGPVVWGVCRRAFANRTDAEDAFQATFLVLIRRARSLTTSQTVGPWLFRVAAWTVRTQRRKAARFPSLNLPATLPDPQLADVPPDFDAVLLGLPERCRAAVLMCHLEGLSHREVAERLGCAEGTVSSLVSRGLAKLRTKFAGRDPSTVLALLGATVPLSLADAAVRSATAFQLASFSAAASPAVVELTRGVLRMFWIKKATATGIAAAMMLAAGAVVGVSVQQTPRAAAEDPPKARENSSVNPPAELSPAEKRLRELEARQDQLAAQEQRLAAERELLAAELAKLRAVMEAKQGLTGPRLSVSVGHGDETHPYSLSELSRDRKAGWSVTFYTPDGTDPSPVREYLTRVMKERDAPRAVHVDVMPAADLDQIKAVLETCRSVGLTRVSIDVRVKRVGGWEAAMGLRTGYVLQQFPEGDLRAFDVNRFLEEVAVFRDRNRDRNRGQPAPIKP